MHGYLPNADSCHSVCRLGSKDLYSSTQMRDFSSITVGWVVLFVVFGMSACASGAGGFAAKIQQPPANNGVTIGSATVEPGTSEFEQPWPFGPLGMDED